MTNPAACWTALALAFGLVACGTGDDELQAREDDLFAIPRGEALERAGERGDYLRLWLPGRAAQEAVGRIVNIDKVRGDEVWAYASPAQLERLGKKGIDFERLPLPGLNPGARMGLLGRGGRLRWDHYPTYAEYVQVMQAWAAAHPGRARLVNLGASTNRQRPHALWAMKISDHPDLDEDEPEVFLTSTMHGDETVGYVLLLRLIEELLTRYGLDPEVTALVDGLEIWVNPLSNPDGTYFSSDTSVSGAVRYYTDAQGHAAWVDPNRNFPDPLAGDHPDGEAWWTETQHMRAFAATRRFALSANFHGGAEVVNYPWDHKPGLHPDDAWFIQLSRSYATLCQTDGPPGYMTDLDHGITNGYAWYFVDGGRQDYMTYFERGREVCVEVSGTKNPSAASLDGYWQSNRRALLTYLGWALRGVRGRVTDPQGAPLAARVTVLGHDQPEERSEVDTDPAAGDYHRLLAPGSYALRFAAEGYLAKEVSPVVVGSGPATRVDVVLSPAERVELHGLVLDERGSPVAGALVELAGSARPPTETRRNGAYALADVFEGRLAVRVTRPGFADLLEEREVTRVSARQDFVLLRVQVVFSSDFEPSNGGLGAAGSPAPGWQWGIPGAGVMAHSGSRAWGTALAGNYPDSADWRLELGPLALPAGGATLAFWHRFETESGYDGGQILVSADGGAYQLVTPSGGYPQGQVQALQGPGYAGNSGGWQPARVDLTPFAGRSIRVRFRFASDSSQTDLGWYLDDMEVAGRKAP